MDKIYRVVLDSVKNQKYKYRWKSAMWSVALLTTFLTTYFLILPAITIENQTVDQAGIQLEQKDTTQEEASFESSDSTTQSPAISETSIEIASSEVSQETLPSSTQTQVSSIENYLDTTLTHQGQGYQVKVVVGADARLPQETSLRVQEIEKTSGEYKTYKEQALEKVERKESDVKSIKLYDIKLMVGEKEVQPQAPIQVEVLYDEPIEVTDEEIEIVHFKEDGQLEVLKSKNTEETKATTSDVAFETGSFSVYAIVQPDGTTVPRITYQFENANGSPYYFKTSTGTDTNIQIVKDGESLHGVGIPYVGDDQHFNGWYEYNPTTKTLGNEVLIEHPIVVSEEKTVIVRPSYGRVAYVTFYNDATGKAILEQHQVAIQYGPGTVDLSEHMAPAPSSTEVFAGWSLTPGGPIVKENVKNYSITGDTKFYPIFKEAKKIEFNTGDIGNGAPYVAPKYVLEGELANSAKPTDPIRNGYTFGGWYTTETGGTQFNFSSTVTSDIILYARWIPATANYTVVFWQQSKLDNKNAGAGQKTYDYVGQINRTGTVESTVYLQQSDFTAPTGFYYTSARGESGTVVRADGSSIINVYFDRRLITMRFLNNNYYNIYSSALSVTDSRWTSSSFANYVTTYTGLYGTSLAENGYTWPSSGNQNWGYYATGGASAGMSYLGEFILPDSSYFANETRFFRRGTQDVRYYFYKQNIDGSYNNNPTDTGTGQTGNFTFTEKYTGFNVAWYTRNYAGTNTHYDTSWRRAANGAITYTYDTTYGYPLDLYIRFERKRYNIHFLDPLNNKDLVNFDPVSALYEDTIAKYQPNTTLVKPTPSLPGYRWNGKWYKDQTLTQEIDWSITMPSHDLKAYAGWEKIRYNIIIDPGGGELLDTQATYFKLNYGEKITEYANITRNYVEDPNGEYYYRYDREDGEKTDGRHAHYTKNPTEPNVDTTKRYRYEEDAYKLIGWYYVDSDGNTRPYNFSGVVVGDTTLRAVWRRVGEYHVVYSPIVYGLDGKPILKDDGSNVQATNLPTDSNNYDDQSHSAMLTRPTASSDYRFRGWYYDGKIYNPHDSFIIKASLADSNKNITIHPVYKPVADLEVKNTKIVYDGNGGSKKITQNGTVAEVTQVTIDHLDVNSVVETPDDSYFKRIGYNLIGWNENKTSATAGQVQFGLGQKVGLDNRPDESNTLYAVWEPKVYTITITKKVIGNQSDKNRTFTFTPSDNLQDENFTLKDGENKTFINIPYGTEITIDEQEYRDFTRKETVTHRNLASGESERTYEANGLAALTVDGDIDIVFTNTRSQQRLAIQKVSVENINQPLQGAKFNIYREASDGNMEESPLYTGLISDGNGNLRLDNANYIVAPLGNYYIVETKAPDGYNLEKEAMRVSVMSDSVTLIQNGNSAPSSSSFLENGEKLFTMKVTNSRGVELPNTGGIGRHIFLVSGLILILPAILILKKRKITRME